MEDAWNAVERAKSIYKHIDNVASVEATKDEHAFDKPVQAPMPSSGPPGSAGVAARHYAANHHKIAGRKLP
jgi:hypothetical protein